MFTVMSNSQKPLAENADLIFSHSEPLTLGVEIEIQLLDRETLDLKPISPQILAQAERRPELRDKIKAEIFQSMLEINTGICRDAHEVSVDLESSIKWLETQARDLGLRLATAGTHPFANYRDRIIYPAERYQNLIDRNQWIARRLMIFGLHVHVGMRDGEHAIQMNNALLHYVPLLLALSASSPFWRGEDTELASSRITFFEALPTGGHPCQVASWREFSELYAKLLRSQSIRSPKDIWWDLRPSPSFGTLEIRVCDGLPTLEEIVALTALIHSLCFFIDGQISKGRRFAPPPDWILRENKWRASRWGLEASLIVDGDGNCAPLKDHLNAVLSEVSSFGETRKYKDEFALIEELARRGGGYLRQREWIAKNGRDLNGLTDFIAREFEARRPLWDGV